MLLVQALISVLIYDDERRHMSGRNRFRMGYAVAFFIFFIIVWNMLVLLWKLIEYVLKCRAARLAGAIGGLGSGIKVGGLHLDNDFEGNTTKYVKNE